MPGIGWAKCLRVGPMPQSGGISSTEHTRCVGAANLSADGDPHPAYCEQLIPRSTGKVSTLHQNKLQCRPWQHCIVPVMLCTIKALFYLTGMVCTIFLLSTRVQSMWDDTIAYSGHRTGITVTSNRKPICRM
jgi:hypothetical protein